MTLTDLYEHAAALHSYEIQLLPGRPAMFRVEGLLRPFADQPLSLADIDALIPGGSATAREVIRHPEHTFVVTRVQTGLTGACVTLHPIFSPVPALEELVEDEMPTFERILAAEFGLAILSGPMGSGKWTLCSAIADAMNKRMAKRIFVIESKAMHLWESERSVLTHVLVGADCASYQDALNLADSAGADLIAIDEVPDQGTLIQLLHLAERGRLIITVLHSQDLMDSLRRLLELTRPESSTAREIIARMLLVITSQFLLPGTDGNRKPAFAWFVPNAVVRSSIQSGDLGALKDLLETSAGRTVDDSVTKLMVDEKISRDTAVAVLFDR